MKKIAVLLLSKDAVLRLQWLNLEKALYNIEQADTVQQAQQWAAHCADAGEVGLILVDAALVDLTQEAWQQLFIHPAVRVVVGSLSPSDPEGQQMIVAGAKAYFHAYSPMATLQTILQQVNNGYIWVGQNLLSRLLSQVSGQLDSAAEAAGRVSTAWQEGLTTREVEVAQRAALGHSNALIAQDLAISERTVRAHMSAIFDKLAVADRLMLALKVHGVG